MPMKLSNGASNGSLHRQPLDGIKVVEWSVYATGPLAGLILGELGASVIKIEDPARGGDPPRGMRYVGGMVDCQLPEGRNAYFEVMNWNKRGITLNLKSSEGREVAYQLVDKADVFLTNVRPDAISRLGLDYETLSARNPRLVYAQATGYGPEGPDAGRAGVDYIGQARSGMMWGAGTESDPPFYNTSGFPDMGGGTIFSQAILTALLARERFGMGQKVEVSNLGNAMWMQYWAPSIAMLTGRQWPRMDRRRPGNPLYNHYLCADGEWIVMAMLREDQWQTFCGLTGRTDLLSDVRFNSVEGRMVNASDLNAILDPLFQSRTRHAWELLLRSETSMDFDRVQKMSDLRQDSQALQSGYVREMEHPALGTIPILGFPIHFSETPPRGQRLPAPQLGEHTYEVLTELGYSPEDIGQFVTNGVV